MVAPKLSDAHLPEFGAQAEQSLAQDLQRAGVQSLAFARQFHVGELDTLAQLFKASLLRSEDSIKRGGSAWRPHDSWRIAWKGFPLTRKRNAKWTRYWPA